MILLTQIEALPGTGIAYLNDLLFSLHLTEKVPWVPEVFLACGGNFRAGHYKDLTKPETALETSLAPRVLKKY